LRRTKNTSMIGILITIILLIIIVIVSNIKVNKVSYIESGLGMIIMPIQNGLTYLKNWIAGNSTFSTDINNLKEENKELKEKNSKLEQSLRELEIIKAENETLKEYVNLKEKFAQYETIPAYVINKDISNYSDTIIINIGSKDGITENMTVISVDGLVGHVVSVTDTTAKVQTIIDTSSATSCLMSTTRDSIVCKGTLEEMSTLKAMYIPIDATIIEGDSIETSGLGGIYPKGIYVGKVSKVISTKNIADRYVKIETGVNFEKLETVLVITNND